MERGLYGLYANACEEPVRGQGVEKRAGVEARKQAEAHVSKARPIDALMEWQDRNDNATKSSRNLGPRVPQSAGSHAHVIDWPSPVASDVSFGSVHSQPRER